MGYDDSKNTEISASSERAKLAEPLEISLVKRLAQQSLCAASPNNQNIDQMIAIEEKQQDF